VPKKRQRKSRYSLFAAIAVVGAAVAAVCVVYGIWASAFDMEKVDEMPEISGVYDMDGRFYTRLKGEGLQDRILVPASEVSHWFIQALLAREDTRFYNHHGVDLWGILRATVRNLIHMSVREGGSTITQQLARNSFPLGGHNLHRKLLEAFVALRIEHHYSKEQILACYMNRIYFGSRFYGIETASRGYFNKHASQLTLAEAAMLAGVIRGPSRFSPFNDLKAAIAQKDEVLERMASLKMITKAEAERQINARLDVAKTPPPPPQNNYALDAVVRDLNIILSTDQIKAGGLKIYTTLDPQLQRSAMAAVDAQLRRIEQRPGYAHPRKPAQKAVYEESTPYLQGAVVVLDNRDGGIRAMVGGRDHADSQLNRAEDASRQLGSTFKPFVYAAAFRQGLLPGAAVDDAPIRPGELHTASNWNPGNSDGANRGVLRAEEGLIQSRNTMSVRIGDYAGIASVRQLAAGAGIPNVPKFPAIFLGAFEESLKDVTAAYSIFPNNGVRKQPFLIERIDDSDGQVVYQAAHITTAALEPGVSWMVSSTLEKVLQRGTAAAARSLGFTKPAAGKTGTTNDYKDAWFVGYTKALTCGVWVGFDTPVTIIPRGYGAALALPIWTQIMNAAPGSRYPAAALAPPEPLQRVRVCSITNQLATAGCESAGTAYDIDLPVSRVPRADCRVHPGGAVEAPAANQEATPAPRGLLQSFRHFFGGH